MTSALFKSYLPALASPSCLHTTVASVMFQILLQIVPHSLLRQISTRPSVGNSPPTSLKSPLEHPEKFSSNISVQMFCLKFTRYAYYASIFDVITVSHFYASMETIE